ncbi:MAG: transcription antitermination factor NusB [Phycisphaerae bacterium]
MTTINEKRSAARRIALQAIYQAEVQGDSFIVQMLPEFINQATADNDIRQLATLMACGAWDYRNDADQWAGRLMPHWTVSRLAAVDRNILRLALWELARQSQTPGKVTLDEAINMAREYSTAESSAFINGVMDAAFKQHTLLTNTAKREFQESTDGKL